MVLTTDCFIKSTLRNYLYRLPKAITINERLEILDSIKKHL